MENKLQELTDKLYKEGLSKGKEEGEGKVLTPTNSSSSSATATTIRRFSSKSRWTRMTT